MNATPGLFGPIEGRVLPPVVRHGYRIIMVVFGQEFYITTYHGPAEKAQRYASRLEAQNGRHKYEAREVGT